MATAHHLVRVMWAMLKRGTFWEEKTPARAARSGRLDLFLAVARAATGVRIGSLIHSICRLGMAILYALIAVGDCTTRRDAALAFAP